MTTTMPAPAHSAPALEDITKRAMLVDLNISMWSAKKHDKTISQEVATSHNADSDLGRYSKTLMPKSATKPVTDAASALRQEHYRRTLPWKDDGARILLASGHHDYCQAMRKLEDEFRSAVAQYLAGYETNRDAQLARAGSLISLDEFPPASKIRDKFACGYNILPMPSGDDFRVNVGSMETARIQQVITERTLATIQQAMQDPIQRIKDAVGHMAARLKAYSEKVSAGAKGPQDTFKDTLVENIRDLIEILPTLNITQDPNLDLITQAMRDNLCQFNAQTLRDSESARSNVEQAANLILEMVDAYI